MAKNFYAVILAGGSGTRFWPLSRRLNPKQFLDLRGEGSLLAETIERVIPFFPLDKILIVGNSLFRKKILGIAASFKIPLANLLFEPQGKNTAIAVYWAAHEIQKNDPHAVMAVFPADHLILRPKAFLKVLTRAFKAAEKNLLVTLGIVPTRPETGYGYLKTSKARVGNFLLVERFLEKPAWKVAQKIFKKDGYFWNSGIFIWKVSAVLEEFQKYLPKVHRLFTATFSKRVEKFWRYLPSISIDYGILEKAKNVAVVPASSIGWSDLGSWESLRELFKKDSLGNVLKGDVVAVDCRNSFIWGHRKLIACLGLEEMMVVDTDDALLICPGKASQHVRDIVDFLKRKDRREW